MDFLAIAQGQMTARKKEISLSTLKQKEIDKIMSAFQRGKDAANNYYRSTVEPAIIKRKELYEASAAFYNKKFAVLAELSSWVSRDVKTTIDWIMPSLLEAFVGSDDPADIKGANINDDAAAEKIQAVIKYQTTKKNNLYVFLYHLLREGLITNEGIAKISWKREEERVEMKVFIDETNAEEFISRLMLGQIEIKKAVPVGDGIGYSVVYDDISVKYNAPLLENLSPDELRFTPEGTTIYESKFVAQRKIVKGDYLKRKEREGIYKNVDKALEAGTGDTMHTDLAHHNNAALNSIETGTLNDDDKASKDVELYEAYLKVDYNGDGIYENVIVHVVEQTPVAIQINEYEMPPFFVFAPECDAFSPFSAASFADTLEQLQDLKTALIRQIIIATGKNNKPQRFVRLDRVDADALINGEEIIDVGDTNPAEVVMTAPPINISPFAMEIVQYAQTIKNSTVRLNGLTVEF